MNYHYPTPAELGIRIPNGLIEKRFLEGFRYALNGGQLSCSIHFRLSFREGYRAGKLYLKQLRRQQGIVEFPLQGKIRFRAA